MKADRIIAVDPGGTTGVVLICDGNTEWLQFAEPALFIFWLDRELARGQAHYNTTIVCESWQGRGGAMTAQYDAQNIIGWLWGESVRATHRFKLVMQRPGDREWTTKGKLAATGIKIPVDHAKQAFRHAIRYIMFSNVNGLAIHQIRTAVHRYIENESA